MWVDLLGDIEQFSHYLQTLPHFSFHIQMPDRFCPLFPSNGKLGNSGKLGDFRKLKK